MPRHNSSVKQQIDLAIETLDFMMSVLITVNKLDFLDQVEM